LVLRHGVVFIIGEIGKKCHREDNYELRSTLHTVISDSMDTTTWGRIRRERPTQRNRSCHRSSKLVPGWVDGFHGGFGLILKKFRILLIFRKIVIPSIYRNFPKQ
jgi:hypothetical protein